MKCATLLLSVPLLTLSLTAMADDYASKDDAIAMVGKVIAAIKVDKQKTYDAINARAPEWIIHDLYPVVYDFQGKVLAHGQNAALVGTVMLEKKDPDGKLFIKERIDLAQSQGTFWQDYKYADPVSKNVLPKQMYCQRLDDSVVCAGVYKR